MIRRPRAARRAAEREARRRAAAPDPAASPPRRSIFEERPIAELLGDPAAPEHFTPGVRRALLALDAATKDPRLLPSGFPLRGDVRGILLLGADLAGGVALTTVRRADVLAYCRGRGLDGAELARAVDVPLASTELRVLAIDADGCYQAATVTWPTSPGGFA